MNCVFFTDNDLCPYWRECLQDVDRLKSKLPNDLHEIVGEMIRYLVVTRRVFIRVGEYAIYHKISIEDADARLKRIYNGGILSRVDTDCRHYFYWSDVNFRCICGNPVPRQEHWVYFIQESGNGYIKIGTSTNVESRLDSLRTSSPYELTLLGTTKGGYDKEKELHERFKEWRTAREWFSPSPEILQYIKQVVP